MRILVFIGWAWVGFCVLVTIACAVGGIWADNKELSNNLADTGWMGFVLSVMSAIGVGILTAAAVEKGKL